MKLWKKICLIILSLLFIGISFPSAIAQASNDVVMSLNPATQDLELEAGQTTSASVEVHNFGQLPFELKVSVAPYYVANNNYDPDFSTETAQTKLYNWIKLDKDTYHVEPGGVAKVNFSVTVPEDTPAGGQYAAIMLSTDSEQPSGESMIIASRLAAILYGHVKGTNLRTEGKLVDRTFPGFITSGDFSVSQSVENTGNVDFRVTQTLTITDFFTNREIANPESVDADQQTFAYNSATVLPGTTRTGILTWKTAPKLGLFTVTQRITFLDQDLTFSRLVFFCPIWLLVVVIALVIALIIWLLLRLHTKRKQKKANFRDF